MADRDDELAELIRRAQARDGEAYDRIVRRFQDMAVGYAYALLGDFHAAEDAAQEAFLQVFFDLPALREPWAFASWLRRIVFKYCDRSTRRRVLPVVPLEAVVNTAGSEGEPAPAAERAELRGIVQSAIAALPERERTAVLLFYLGERSQQQIAAFLAVPVNTIKKRLQRARQKLEKELLIMLEADLPGHAPSRDADFGDRVRSAVEAVTSGDVAALVHLLRAHPGLANVRAADGRTLLNHLADWPGHWPNEMEVGRTLIAAGADVNARAGDPVKGETPLQWAVSSDDVAIVELLLDAGASPDGVDDDRRPLAQALWYGSLASSELLVRRGATFDLEFAAGLGRADLIPTFFDAAGTLLPAAGRHHQPQNVVVAAPEGAGPELLEQALVYAAIGGHVAAAAALLDRGAQINAQPTGFDVAGSPLHWAASNGHTALVEYLVQHGADVALRDPRYQLTPRGWAEHFKQAAVFELLQRLGVTA